MNDRKRIMIEKLQKEIQNSSNKEVKDTQKKIQEKMKSSLTSFADGSSSIAPSEMANTFRKTKNDSFLGVDNISVTERNNENLRSNLSRSSSRYSK